MPIGEICTREVVIADRDFTASAAARLMREYHVGSVVIVQSLEGPRRPVGIVTDRDIVVEVVAKQVDPDAVKLGEMVTGHIATVKDSDSISDTLRYMREHGCRRMPVVNELGELEGIVSMDDYVGLLAEEMMDISKLIAHEQERESKSRL